ncbi:MAG: sigma 54-interacting transcriptional regulator, partial [Desulfamplus sp.]|nr:sigma 54-interacting transcriptional regulator [Desulfamplus sp.]
SVKTIKSNVRIVAATNRDLLKMVEEEKFRIDLFYRINVVKIDLPPLRERMEDIPLLVDHFIERLNRIRGRAVQGIEQSALKLLMAHPFSGNIREMQNIIEHAFILCSDGKIALEHLPATFNKESKKVDKVADGSIKSAEIETIQSALKRNNYNRSRAAKELGIHKTTLFRKIAKFGIELPDGVDGRS